MPNEKCTECKEFAGTPENEGLCSSCFRTKFPAKEAERKQKAELRLVPVRKWEQRWLKAVSSAEATEVRATLDEMEKAKVSEFVVIYDL